MQPFTYPSPAPSLFALNESYQYHPPQGEFVFSSVFPSV